MAKPRGVLVGCLFAQDMDRLLPAVSPDPPGSDSSGLPERHGGNEETAQNKYSAATTPMTITTTATVTQNPRCRSMISRAWGP
jgi:hypothetical protein